MNSRGTRMVKFRRAVECGWLRIGKWVKPCFGIVLLGAFAALVPFSALLEVTHQADNAALAMAFIVWCSVVLLEAGRLVCVFRAWSLPVRTAIRIFLAGSFVGNFAPGTIGLDVFQVFVLKRERVDLIDAVSLTFVLRAVGLLINLLIAIAVVALSSSHAMRIEQAIEPAWHWLSDYGGAMALSTVLLVIVIAAIAFSIVRRRASAVFHRMAAGIRGIRSIDFGAIVLLSALVVLSRAFSQVLLVDGFGGALTLSASLLVAATAVVAAAMPITPAGLGVREAAAGALLILFGVEPPVAVAVALTQRGFMWSISLVGWGVLARTFHSEQ